jgi:HEAT repeat protein
LDKELEGIERLRIRGEVEKLIKLLSAKNPKIRALVAEALGDFEREDVIDALLQALKDEDQHVRWNAAKSLLYISKDKIERLVEEFYRSDSVYQKISLIWIFGRVGDRKASKAVLHAFGSADRYLRRASAIAMGRIADPKFVQPLLVGAKDSDPGLRKRALEALARMGAGEAETAFLDALLDSSPEVRRTAAKCLEKIGWRPKSGEEFARYLLSLKIGSKLVMLGDQAIEPLLDAIRSGDRDLKDFASEVISSIGTRKAIKALESLKDEDEVVRYYAVKSLVKIGKEAEKEISAFLEDPNPRIREIAEKFKNSSRA